MVNLQEKRRNHRIQTINSWIAKAKSEGKTLNKEKLISIICIDMGTSRRTALEYVKVIDGAIGIPWETPKLK